jgi:hypothetical protein
METTQSILTIHVFFTKLVKRIFFVLFYMLSKIIHDILFKHGIVVLYYSVKFHKSLYVVRAFKLFSFLCSVLCSCVLFFLRHDIAEILLMLALNTNQSINQSIIYVSLSCVLCCQCLWILRCWLPLLFSLTFIYDTRVNNTINVSHNCPC